MTDAQPSQRKWERVKRQAGERSVLGQGRGGWRERGEDQALRFHFGSEPLPHPGVGGRTLWEPCPGTSACEYARTCVCARAKLWNTSSIFCLGTGPGLQRWKRSRIGGGGGEIMGGNEKQLRAFVGEGRLKPEEEEGMRQAWPPPPVREKSLSVCRGGLRVGGNGTSTGLSRLLQKERERTKLCVGGVWAIQEKPMGGVPLGFFCFCFASLETWHFLSRNLNVRST